MNDTSLVCFAFLFHTLVILIWESVLGFDLRRAAIYSASALLNLGILLKLLRTLGSELQTRCSVLESDVHGLSHDIRGPLQASIFASEILRKELESEIYGSNLTAGATEKEPVKGTASWQQPEGGSGCLPLDAVVCEKLMMIDLIRSNMIFASLMATNVLEKMCDASSTDDGESSTKLSFSIDEIVENVISTVKGLQLAEDGLETAFCSRTAGARVVCDLQQVQRLIMNLTINAIKFSKVEDGNKKEGDPRSHVEVSVDVLPDLEAVRLVVENDRKHARHQEKKVHATTSKKDRGDVYLVVTVSDEGEGMSKEALKMCAEGSPRVSRRKRGGFGLGLYLTKRFCCDHAGGLVISSTQTIGTTITAYFAVGFVEGETPSPGSNSEMKRVVAGSKKVGGLRSGFVPSSPAGSFTALETLGESADSGSALEDSGGRSKCEILPEVFEKPTETAIPRKLPPIPHKRDSIPGPESGPSGPAGPEGSELESGPTAFPGPRSFVFSERPTNLKARIKRRRTVAALDLIICDDDTSSLRLSQRLLSDRVSGVVYTFSRAEAALECISEMAKASSAGDVEVEQPEKHLILLTDLNFVTTSTSCMQGRELIRRAKEVCPRIKVVAMTGEPLHNGISETGADRVMFKPVTSAQVDSVFRSLFLVHPISVRIKSFVELDR